MAGASPSLTIAQHFLITAAHSAELPALCCADVTLNYRSAAAAVQRAAASVAAAPASDAPIAILGRLDAWTPLLLLAVFYSGRTACVLDSGLPAARLHELLDDLAPALVLSTDARHAELLDARAPFSCLPPEQLLTGPLPDVECREQLDTAALIQYSSGTTGRPKGIVRSQRALIDHTWIHYADHAPQPGDAIASLYHPAYGAATSDIFAALLNGALLQIIDPTTRSPSQLAAALLDADLTHLHLHAALLKPLSDALPVGTVFTRLRSLRPSDRTDGADLQRFAAFLPTDCTVHHTLSSIETGPMARFQQPAGAVWLPGPLPVGRPLPGLTLRLLDDAGNPVAPGTIGRIEVSGPGVALGYWRDPQRTNEVFFATADPAVRTFRSNDLACLLPSGNLQLHGRTDRRVKIRGHSVALDAVEQALIALPGVAAAAAVALPDRHGNLRLIAYVTPQPDTVCDPLRINAALRRSREAALVPQRIVVLDQLPCRPNGKIDYQALPPPGRSRPPQSTAFAAPETPLALQIATIWSDLLDIEQVGADDDFFLLGGDSIRALQLLQRLEDLIGRPLPAGLLVTAPTVRQQAAAVTTLPPQSIPALPAGRKPTVRRVSLARKRTHTLLRLFQRLPRPPARSLLSFLTRLGVFRILRIRPRQQLELIARGFGNPTPIDTLWFNYLMQIHLQPDTQLFLAAARGQTTSVQTRLIGSEELTRAFAAGTGVILVGIHAVAQRAMTVVLTDHLACGSIKTISAVKLQPKPGDLADAAARRGSLLYAAHQLLRAGAVVKFALDGQFYFHQEQRPVTMAGRTRHVSAGFAELALLSGAPVFPAFPSFTVDGLPQLTVEIGPPLSVPPMTLPHDERVDALLQQFADRLTNFWHRHPTSIEPRFLAREAAWMQRSQPTLLPPTSSRQEATNDHR